MILIVQLVFDKMFNGVSPYIDSANMYNFRKERYVAGMILSGVGDALGYKNGEWEFCCNAEQIHKEVRNLGGLENICVKEPQWRVSDDTVMHLATAQALIQNNLGKNNDSLMNLVVSEYKRCVHDMSKRDPGKTCMAMCKELKPYKNDGLLIPFNTKGGGCGAAMRSMCIGLRFPKQEDIDTLVAVSIESGRLTHHHPTGYLGSLTSALFTSYAVQGKPLTEWGVGLLNTLERAKAYIEKRGVCVKDNVNHWEYFNSKWQFYLGLRNILDGKSEPRFPTDYRLPKKRDQFYTFLSFDSWGGASGHDAPMIAFDALLACERSWTELCNIAMFHGGDSDSTGTIAGCLYGVLYGFENVPESNYKTVEYHDILKSAAENIFCLAEGKHVNADDAHYNRSSSRYACCTV